MSDLQRYIANRKTKDAAFAKGFEDGYVKFKLGTFLPQVRETVGLIQADMTLPRRLGCNNNECDKETNDG